VIKKEAEKILKYEDLTIEIQRTWNVNNKSYTSKKRSSPLKIIQRVSEQHTGKKRNEGTTLKNHIWHYTHTYIGMY